MPRNDDPSWPIIPRRTPVRECVLRDLRKGNDVLDTAGFGSFFSLFVSVDSRFLSNDHLDMEEPLMYDCFTPIPPPPEHVLFEPEVSLV